MRPGRLAADHYERGNILGNCTAHRGKAVLADLGKLMHQREPSQNGVAVQMHMPGQRSAIGHNDVIADDAIVRYVGICHKQVVIAYLGKAFILLGASMHGGILAYRISIADFQPGDLGRILLVLGIFADGRELIDTILLTYRGRPFNNDMGTYNGTRINLYIRPDNGKRADRHVISQLRLAINYRCWINQINLPRPHI